MRHIAKRREKLPTYHYADPALYKSPTNFDVALYWTGVREYLKEKALVERKMFRLLMYGHHTICRTCGVPYDSENSIVITIKTPTGDVCRHSSL